MSSLFIDASLEVPAGGPIRTSSPVSIVNKFSSEEKEDHHQFCKNKGIELEPVSPLSRNSSFESLKPREPANSKIADEHCTDKLKYGRIGRSLHTRRQLQNKQQRHIKLKSDRRPPAYNSDELSVELQRNFHPSKKDIAGTKGFTYQSYTPTRSGRSSRISPMTHNVSYHSLVLHVPTKGHVDAMRTGVRNCVEALAQTWTTKGECFRNSWRYQHPQTSPSFQYKRQLYVGLRAELQRTLQPYSKTDELLRFICPELFIYDSSSPKSAKPTQLPVNSSICSTSVGNTALADEASARPHVVAHDEEYKADDQLVQLIEQQLAEAGQNVHNIHPNSECSSSSSSSSISSYSVTVMRIHDVCQSGLTPRTAESSQAMVASRVENFLSTLRQLCLSLFVYHLVLRFTATLSKKDKTISTQAVRGSSGSSSSRGKTNDGFVRDYNYHFFSLIMGTSNSSCCIGDGDDISAPFGGVVPVQSRLVLHMWQKCKMAVCIGIFSFVVAFLFDRLGLLSFLDPLYKSPFDAN